MKETARSIEEPAFACVVDIQVGAGVTGVPEAADLTRWASVALQEGGADAEMCLRIVDEREIQALNREYRMRDEVTNVLSFPCDLEDETGVRLRGDVVICAARVAREASDQGKAQHAHWAHLVTHGTLHLLGYDHQTEEESAEMEGLETRLLAAQGFADPY